MYTNSSRSYLKMASGTPRRTNGTPWRTGGTPTAEYSLYPNLILLNSHFCFSLIQNYKIFFVLLFRFQITNYKHYKKYRSK